MQTIPQNDSPSRFYVDTLEFLYSKEPTLEPIKKSTPESNGSDGDEHDRLNSTAARSHAVSTGVLTINNAKYEAYFSKLNEDLKDYVKSWRKEHKGLQDRPPSLKARGIELAFAICGVLAPVAGAVSAAMRHGPQMIKQGKELASAIQNGLHAAEIGTHGVKELGEAYQKGVHLSHRNSEDSYKVPPSLRGYKLDAFIDKITEELTYRFRHEITNLTESQCEELASRHHTEIKNCLENITTTEIKSQKDLESKLKNLIDPKPKDEIRKQIYACTSNRIHRTLDITTEEECIFEKELYKKFIKGGNIENCIFRIKSISDIMNLISEINSIRFHNFYLLSYETIVKNKPYLSLSNHHVKTLAIPEVEQTFPLIKNHEFYGPNPQAAWFGSYYVSMKSMCEKIILILMRYLIKKTMKAPQNQEINEQTRSFIHNLTLHPQVKELMKRISDQDARISDQDAKFAEIPKMVENLTAQAIHKILAQRRDDARADNTEYDDEIYFKNVVTCSNHESPLENLIRVE